MFQEWGDADIAESQLLCAEMSRLVYARQAVVSEALPRAKFALVASLGGPRLPEQFRASTDAVLFHA